MNADSRPRSISAAIRAALTSRPRLTALLIYLGFSTLLFGRAAAPHFTTIYLGRGIDQAFFIWCLVWWPYALAHHLNPFVTKLIFAPTGFNLTWSTSIPLLSLLALPLTATVGPITTFNLLCVACPAITAWTAFLLCHNLTGRFGPSLLGGYIFGFSSYMLAQMFGGHLNLLAAFLIPLAMYLVLARLQGRIERRAFTLALLALATAQFLIATEILATMTVFGALGLATAWAMGERDLRRRIAELAAPIFLAYLGMAILVSPYLYYLVTGFRTAPIYSPSRHSADLLNFMVPTTTVALGSAIGLFRSLSARFTSDLSEQAAYIGLPLLALAIWFVFERRRSLEARLLGLMLMVTAVAAMGPRLHVRGNSYFKLPWSLLHRAPLIDQALPLRLTVYVFLMLALVAAMWLAAPHRSALTRAAAAALVLASLFPNPSARVWAEPGKVAPAPGFFTAGTYRRYLAPGEIVATLPYAWGEADACMLWQALSGMYFRLAGGYPALSPLSFRRWPIVRSANQLATIPDPADQWKAFAANHEVTAVLRGDNAMPSDFPSIDPIVEALTALGASTVATGGITLYRVPPAALAPYRGLDWARMEALADAQRFGVLLIAAQRYLASGADPAGLSPLSAAKAGLLPAAWLTTRSRGNDYRLYMRIESDGLITLGLLGTRKGVQPIIDRYSVYARRFHFSDRSRTKESSHPGSGTYYYALMMSFDRQGLERAAALALTEPPRLVLDSKSHSN
ncbi:MAG TPA: hypothetical protein VNE82_23465 [Candidatus Binataceae bacterium]|nr:hypothetical protein [Candidatus Binataceae bacterium]